jgi:DNA-binding PadR family transcriptional regulator
MHRFHFNFGRHHGGRGLGRFGRGFVDGEGPGGRGFGMGRKLASVDLQLLILALLEQKPSHGYEIIKALDERSGGFYVPSPGMIYPALTYLEEIGHATVEADGSRKRYHITDLGKQHLAQHRETAMALFAQFERVGERMDKVRRAMGAQDSEDFAMESPGRGSKELALARRDLKMALASKTDGSAEQETRLIGILKRATAEILGH